MRGWTCRRHVRAANGTNDGVSGGIAARFERRKKGRRSRSTIGLLDVPCIGERVLQLVCLALRRFPLARSRVSLFLERMIRRRTNMDTKSEYSFKLSTSGSLTP